MESQVNGADYSDFFMDDPQSTLRNSSDYTCYLCHNTYEKDLQLAAELGKTLLERNKELEATLKHHQTVIEDQTQEIEYLTKQTAALKEVNDSRLRIYEQLEVGIQDLERTNQKLNQQTASDKKQIKSLFTTIETLESRCEELQHSLDKLSVDLESEKRKFSSSQSPTISSTVNRESHLAASSNIEIDTKKGIGEEDDGEIKNLWIQIHEMKSERRREQKKISELIEQLNSTVKENSYLEEQLDTMKQKEEDFKGMQEELSMLEQIRQGQLCRRCLRTSGTPETEDTSVPFGEETDGDNISDIDSIIESQRNEVLKQIQETLQDDSKSENPYRVLVEKYEALLKVQQKLSSVRVPNCDTPQNCLNLQEELQLTGKFSSFEKDGVDSDNSECEASPKFKNKLTGDKSVTTKSSDFLEAETSSSGFSDDTSNKGTQTDIHVLPGSFLCKISDGTDCQFSIYDNASPIESRFRKTPEYRQLFKEIFAVLKRAAEAKDEGEPLPLLDDYITSREDFPKVPPVTPAKEENPLVSSVFNPTIIDDKSSDNSTSDVKSFDAKNECKNTTPADNVEPEQIAKAIQQNSPKRNRLEQLANGVKLRKKDKRNKQTEGKHSAEASPSHSSKRNNSKGRKRREINANSPARSRERHQQRSSCCVSFPKPEDIPSRNNSPFGARSGNNKDRPKSFYELPTYSSSASQEVAKLRILEKSYAEVLRMGRKKQSRQSQW